MNKRHLPIEQLEKVCLVALAKHELPVTKVELSVVGCRGARANWEVRALSPEPGFTTAETALKIIGDLQNLFEIEGNPKPVSSILS